MSQFHHKRFCIVVQCWVPRWFWDYRMHWVSEVIQRIGDRIRSTTPGADPPRDARDSGSARSHSTHLETSSSDRP